MFTERTAARWGRRKPVIAPLMAVLFLAGFGLAMLSFAPLAACPWCNGEIKHWGGLKRYCDGASEGCDGTGWTSILRRWNSLLERDLRISSRR